MRVAWLLVAGQVNAEGQQRKFFHFHPLPGLASQPHDNEFCDVFVELVISPAPNLAKAG